MADYPDPTMPGPANSGVAGDSKAMPDRGTSSGMVGEGAPYGADISMGATNRLGPCTDCYSDPMDRTMPIGDSQRFTSSGHSTTDPGSHFTANSDPADEVTPDDTRGSPDPDNT